MIDINKKEDIKRIQKQIMEELDKKYEEISLHDMLESLKDEPLYTLNNIFENVSSELCNTKNGKKCLAKYVKTIKENASLLNAYAILSNINHLQNIKSTDIFVNEVASLSKHINKKEYNAGIKALSEAVKDSIVECKAKSETIAEVIKKSHTELNEAVNYIIEHKKNISNVAEYSNNMAVITEEVNKLSKTVESSSCDKSVQDLMAEINESAEGFSREETNAIKEMALSTISGKDAKEIYESFKNKCLNLLNETVNSDISVEDKARFQKMIEQINGKEYKQETLNEDVLNFARLYETLKES